MALWGDGSGATRSGTPGMRSAQRTPNASCDAPAGAVVATSPVSMSCGYTVAFSLRLCRRRLVSAFASRPPGAAGGRRAWISIRRSRQPAELGLRRRAVTCCSATGVATRSMRREPTPASDIPSDASCEAAGSGEALRGVLGHRPKWTALQRETDRHVARSEGTWSLLSGRVCRARAVAATSRLGAGRTPHRPGSTGCGSEAMALRFR